MHWSTYLDGKHTEIYLANWLHSVGCIHNSNTSVTVMQQAFARTKIQSYWANSAMLMSWRINHTSTENFVGTFLIKGIYDEWEKLLLKKRIKHCGKYWGRRSEYIHVYKFWRQKHWNLIYYHTIFIQTFTNTALVKMLVLLRMYTGKQCTHRQTMYILFYLLRNKNNTLGH